MQKQNVGNAGEYYIASRLSAEDFVTTITLGRAEKYDILAISPKNKTIKISVKARLSENAPHFQLSEKDENGASADFYYAFIRLNEFKKEPDFWIIPSKIVCPVIKEADAKWLATLGKKGQIRNGSSMRKLPIVVRKNEVSNYPKNWESGLKRYYKNIKQLI